MPGLDPKHNSRALLEGPARAAARAQLKGIGFDDEALAKPIIGVATTWTETMPCNFHHRALAAKVKEGVKAAGGTPMEFNTIAISDGITMGTEGMRASLVSRELIAEANLHLPGRQIDPRQVHRDIWRLGRWERERLERRAGAPGPDRATQ